MDRGVGAGRHEFGADCQSVFRAGILDRQPDGCHRPGYGTGGAHVGVQPLCDQGSTGSSQSPVSGTHRRAAQLFMKCDGFGYRQKPAGVRCAGPVEFRQETLAVAVRDGARVQTGLPVRSSIQEGAAFGGA